MIEQMTPVLPEFETAIESLAEATGIVQDSAKARDARPTTGTLGEGANAELPKVDLKLNQVQYRDQCYPVTSEGALLFAALVRNHPHFFAAYKHFSKPSRTKDALPDALKALIVAEPGKGYRLDLG
jgi:hypothetical protein